MADIFSDEGVFVVLPEYVLDADISSNALRLYAVLRRYADNRSLEAHPSRKTLAERMNLKDPRVVDRAAVELVDAELLIMFPRYRDEDGNVARHQSAQFREQTSNGYRLIRPPMPPKEGGRASNGTGGSASNGTTGVPETVPKLEPSFLNPVGLEGAVFASGAPRPDLQCARHLNQKNPPNCIACKESRLAAEKWDRDQAEWRSEERVARGRSIASCDQCDDFGWARNVEPVVRCDHSRRDAEIVPCPTCHAAARTPCVWATGERRRLPCLARMKAAERYDAADPQSSAEPDVLNRPRPVQLDSELSQRDITEPLHPMEDQ